MTHLLDTNAWIMFLRQKDANFLQRARRHMTADLALCSVALGELLYGAYHGSATQLVANLGMVSQLRTKHVSLQFDDSAAEEYGKIRHHLATLGTPIGGNDMMIASIALANNLIVVTHNTAEYSRIPGLKIEDWQTP
jgi:tRNA(fMet)-specific endonuclease VapC